MDVQVQNPQAILTTATNISNQSRWLHDDRNQFMIDAKERITEPPGGDGHSPLTPRTPRD